MRTLMQYPWPGNVRQLRNVARQITISSRGALEASLSPALVRQLSAAVLVAPAASVASVAPVAPSALAAPATPAAPRLMHDEPPPAGASRRKPRKPIDI